MRREDAGFFILVGTIMAAVAVGHLAGAAWGWLTLGTVFVAYGLAGYLKEK